MLIYLILVLGTYSLDIMFIYDSDSTQKLVESLSSDLNTWPGFSYQSYFARNIRDLENVIDSSSSEIIIDMSTSLLIHECISLRSQFLEFTHITIQAKSILNPWEISFLESERKAGVAMRRVLEYHGWIDVILITSDDQYSIQLMDYLYQDISIHIKLLITLSTSTEYEAVKQIIARQVKLSGIRVIVIISRGEISKKVLRACEEAKISKAGFVYLLGPRSMLFQRDKNYSIFENGLLYVQEGFANDPQTEDELIREGLDDMLDIVYEFCNQSKYSSKCNKYTLLTALKSHTETSKSLHLKNIQNSQPISIANFTTENILFSTHVIYIGNTTEFPSNNPNTITISIPSHIAGEDYARQTVFLTAKLGISHINQTPNIIPSFDLIPHDYGYGTKGFNQTSAEASVLPNLNKFETAIMVGSSSGAAISFMSFMDLLGLNKTYIGSTNTATALSSRVNYPRYIRTVPSDSFMPVIYVTMLQFYGWSHIGVIYSDEVWGQGIYTSLVKETESKGIEIINQEEYRKIPPYYSEEVSREYTQAVEKLIESNARVVLLIVYTAALQQILSELYDLGMRRGDIVFIAIEWLTLDLVNNSDPSVRIKIQELLRGTIQFFPMTFIGDIGNKVKEDMMKEYGRESHYQGCFYYDSVWMIGYALDFLLKFGQDYEDPDILIGALRESRFTGCTGLVTIEDSLNDRSPMGYEIINLEYHEDNETWSIKTKGKYDPTSAQALELYQDIQWPDGTSDPPTDLRLKDTSCIVPITELEELDYKNYILLTVCLVSMVMTIIITCAIWRRWWIIEIPTLDTHAEMSIYDILEIIMMCMKSLQYIALGPDISNISPFIQDIVNLSNIDFIKSDIFRRELFWIVIYVTFSTSFIWIVIVSIHYSGLDNKYPRFFFSKFANYIRDSLIPLIGNAGFQPSISILLAVFVCDLIKGKDSLLQNSVLNLDCNEYCWSTNHVIHCSISGVLLILFIGLVVYLKPIWQFEHKSDLHIIKTPYIMLIETLLQVYFAIVGKVLKRSNKLAHSIIFITPLSIFTAFLVYRNGYNYKRASMWEILIHIGVLWVALIATISNFIDISYIPPLAIAGLGWFILILVGIFVMKYRYPSYLSIKSHDIAELFRFAILKQAKRRDIVPHNIMSSEEVSMQEVEAPNEDLMNHSQFEQQLFTSPNLKKSSQNDNYSETGNPK
jgi:ABC-type branched-subunit amino acid transport system substrate-binding protein